MELRKLLEQKKMSQQELADALDIPRNTVWRWVNGRATPSVGIIKPLAAALHVTEAELLNGPESKEIRITLHYSEMPKESEINMNGNEFDLYMSGNGKMGINGAADFATEEDIDNFLARARVELVAGLNFQRGRGAIPTA